MRDTTNLLKRRLQQIAERVKVHRPTQVSLDRLLRISEGAVEPTPAERDYLEAWDHEREAGEPPDKLERLLARMVAEIRGQPDPYGTDGMSEAERRAWDWADYHEKERIS